MYSVNLLISTAIAHGDRIVWLLWHQALIL